MQSKNKNDGVQLSDRYLQYTYAKRHLGGIPERKVFPIGSDNEETRVGIKRIAHMRGFRRYNQTYDPSGIVESIDTSGGGGHQPCIVPTIRASDHKRGDNQTAVVERGMKIRRLTPTECERLMSYPDGWTEGLSDTQRYKTLGNGIVSNVVAEVVKRIL